MYKSDMKKVDSIFSGSKILQNIQDLYKIKIRFFEQNNQDELNFFSLKCVSQKFEYTFTCEIHIFTQKFSCAIHIWPTFWVTLKYLSYSLKPIYFKPIFATSSPCGFPPPDKT